MKINSIYIYPLLVCLSFTGVSQVLAQEPSFEEQKQTTIKIPKLISNLETMYVEDVDKKELEVNILKGMFNRISPFTLYQNSETVSKVFPSHQDKYASLGIKFKFKNDSIIIDEVLSGGGAEKAGLLKGDKIAMVDGENFDHQYYYIEVAERLIGEIGSKTKISYVREGKATDVSVTRTKIPNYSMPIIGNQIMKGAVNDYASALPYFDAIYPDSITNGQITEYGIRYMLEQLDPHSSYISLEDLHDSESPLKGSFSGVGVRFQIDNDTIVVAQAIPGGPSEKVGIQSGDKFVYIDDELVAGTGIKNSGVRDRLLGDKGSKVKVKMYRTGEAELVEFVIERDKIPIHSVDTYYMAAPKVGYIKLNNFSATSVNEVRKAIFSLKKEGMKDLVLDLQNNGGGYLMTAVHLCDELLDGDKNVVFTEGRSYPRKDYNAGRTGLLEKGRVVVLVNESSASASEIVSGAIQDWDRGLIIGRRTFSKGLVQKPVSLTDGTTVRITTSRYFTPSGRCIQKPYEGGSIEYRKEKYERYSSGESFHKDSVKLNKDLKYATKIKGRTVYGGGGIMPDVFVPLDTTGTSDYFSQLVRKGVYSRFALQYVNKNRDALQKKYVTFDQFNKNFKSEKISKELFDFAEEQGVEYDKDGFKKAEKVILVRLKAQIAQNLFSYERYYEVINDLNEILQQALTVLEEDKEFDILK
ncbi:MAG: carboxyl-terminal processing protease [Parvicella sp.]|jgi:carboxyl-terminal processing protease